VVTVTSTAFEFSPATSLLANCALFDSTVASASAPTLPDLHNH
jgi:hypothetical protein